MNLQDKKQTAIQLFSEGTTPDEIANKVEEPLTLIEYWCRNYGAIKEDLEKNSKDISKLIKEWELIDVDEEKIKSTLKKLILMTGIKIASVIPTKELQLDPVSAQALKTHTQSLRELTGLLKDFDVETKDLYSVLAKPVEERIENKAQFLAQNA